jgi:hypothetical protein
VTSPGPTKEDRILIVAPIGADAVNLVSILSEAGLMAIAGPDLTAVASEIESGCSVILVTEEAFNHSRYEALYAVLNKQPPWSDIPIVMIVTGGQTRTSLAAGYLAVDGAYGAARPRPTI